MFKDSLNQEAAETPFISLEEMALIPHKKEASNFINLTQKQRLNILESLLVERCANNEDAEDIMQAMAQRPAKLIAMLQTPTQQPPTSTNIAHSFDIPILSEVGDVLKMATVAGLIIGGVLLVTLGVNPRFCGEQNGSQFCNQSRLVYRYFIDPKSE